MPQAKSRSHHEPAPDPDQELCHFCGVRSPDYGPLCDICYQRLYWIVFSKEMREKAELAERHYPLEKEEALPQQEAALF